VFLSISAYQSDKIPACISFLNPPFVAHDAAKALSYFTPSSHSNQTLLCVGKRVVHIMGDEEKHPDTIGVSVGEESDSTSERQRSTSIPWSMKILSVVLVSLVGFGSHWSSGVTGAMKSTLKKVGSYSYFADYLY
jgi:hypothetical protein